MGNEAFETVSMNGIIFSVIIPVYRDLERLLLCLTALSEQIIPIEVFEVLVINNDLGNELLIPNEFYKKLNVRVYQESRKGSYAARNLGMKKAHGKVLAFTDADCIPDANWLGNAYNYFENDSNRKTGILTGPVHLFYKNPNQLSPAELYEKYTGFTTKAYAKKGHAITANWFSYREVVEEFGAFDDRLKSNGDSDLSGKIASKYKIIYKENIIVHHPARHEAMDLVNKYRRLLGGTFTRKYQKRSIPFGGHVLDFIWRRYRFALKKLFTVSSKEALAILYVCHAINVGALKEYYSLLKGNETKR